MDDTEPVVVDGAVVRRWFAGAVAQYPWHSGALALLSILNSLADGLSISLLIPFLALLFGGADDSSPPQGMLGEALTIIGTVTGPGRELAVVSAAIVGLVALRCAASYAEGMIAAWVSGRISEDIRARIHDNLLKVEFKYISTNDNARLLNALDSQAWSATDAITSYFSLFTSFCMALVFSSLLLFISWQLTLVVAVLIGLLSLTTLPFDRRLRALGATSVTAGEALSERVMELVDAMRMIRAFGRETRAQAAYEQASRRLFDVSLRSHRVAACAGAVKEVLYAANFVAVVFIGLWLDLSGAALIGYLALLHRLQPHVRAIDDARLHLASLGAPVQTVSRLLQLEHWYRPAPDSLRLPALHDAVRFEHVAFAYSGKGKEPRNALDDVTLELAIGKVTAIVGWSGAGKSTLTNLLFRFYDPDRGTITVDGVPLKQLDLDWWRSQLAIAGQDAELVGGTIRDNIAFGRDDATFAAIVDAAERARVHDFIATLPHGYDTQVGGRGLLLSGGQRQRIGLARALLRRSPMLVLDEATNSVDSMTESEILRSLEELRNETTIVVIAHRLSTTRSADHVIALRDGRIAEAGAPAELLRRNGLYAQMVRLQELAHGRRDVLKLIDAAAL